jgi:hypothetical protein
MEKAMNRVLSIAGALIAFVLLIYCALSFQLVSWDFRNNLWAPAYLITQRESAYNIDLVFNDSNAIWFPQIIGLFFFLGFLPQYLATNIWLLLNIALLLVLILYLLRQSGCTTNKPLHLGILGLSVFLFPPTIRHLILGQVDILLMMALIAGVCSIRRQQSILGGSLFALALVKPQHCIVVLPSVFVHLLFTKRAFRDSASLFLATCFFVILQTGPLWFGGPSWINDFLSNLQRNPDWAQPSIFSILHNTLGTTGFVLWFVFYVAIIAINLRIWSRNKPENAILWSLASTAIIGPYLWSWDFVLLLPLFIDTAVRLRTVLSKSMLFGSYVTCFLGSVLALQGGTASDEVLWWLPFVLLLGIAISIVADRRSYQQAVAHPMNPPNRACTGRWGLCRILEHLSGVKSFLLPSRGHPHPSASDANRWAACPDQQRCEEQDKQINGDGFYPL